MYFRANRTFTFLISPNSTTALDWIKVEYEIDELRRIGVHIKLLIDDSFRPIEHFIFPPYPPNCIEYIERSYDCDLAGLSTHIRQSDGFTQSILACGEDAREAKDVLKSCISFKIDGLVTDNPLLVDMRYNLALAPERIRIVKTDELLNIIRIIAHGHNYFGGEQHNRQPSVYYAAEHKKGKEYYIKYEKMIRLLKDEEARELLRNLILNRLMQIMHTRDLLVFYDMQHDHYETDIGGMDSNYYFGFYNNYYYYMIWGLLEQLTYLINATSGINAKRCGIRKQGFWEINRDTFPGLYAFVHSIEIREWIQRIADIRHPASHKRLPQIATVLSDDSESLSLSDEDVAEIIEKENPDLKIIPTELREIIIGNSIAVWRTRNADVLFTKTGMGKRGKKTYFFQPTIEVDYHFEMVCRVLDRFLDEVERFATQTP